LVLGYNPYQYIINLLNGGYFFMNEMVNEYMESYKEDLNKVLNKLEDAFSMIRVGRANPKIVEKIMACSIHGCK
jgi:hypothetical protein